MAKRKCFSCGAFFQGRIELHQHLERQHPTLSRQVACRWCRYQCHYGDRYHLLHIHVRRKHSSHAEDRCQWQRPDDRMEVDQTPLQPRSQPLSHSPPQPLRQSQVPQGPPPSRRLQRQQQLPPSPPQPQPENFGHLRPEVVAERSRQRVRYPSPHPPGDEDMRFVEWLDLPRYHPTPLGRPFPEVLDATEENNQNSPSTRSLPCTEDVSASPHHVFEEPPASPGGPARSTSADATTVPVAAPLPEAVICDAGPEQLPSSPASTVGYSVEEHSGEEPVLPNTVSLYAPVTSPISSWGEAPEIELLDMELTTLFNMGSNSPARMPPPDVPDKAPEEPQSPRVNWRASMGRPCVRTLSVAEARRYRQRRRPGTRRGPRPSRLRRSTVRLTQLNPILLPEEPTVERRAITGPFRRTLSLVESRRARHRPRSSVQWIAPPPSLPRRNPKRKCRLYGRDYARRLGDSWSKPGAFIRSRWGLCGKLTRAISVDLRSTRLDLVLCTKSKSSVWWACQISGYFLIFSGFSIL